MAVSINTGGTYNVTRLSNADALTGWSANRITGTGGAPTAFASVGSIDLVAEGTDAVATVVNKQRVILMYKPTGGFDFTPDSSGTGTVKVPYPINQRIVYVWGVMLAAGSILTKAAGGFQLVAGDTIVTNPANVWNVAGSDTYSGGFVKWARSFSIAGDSALGSGGLITDFGLVQGIGMIADVGGTTTRFDNFAVDAVDFGNGLTFQGTTVSDLLFEESAAQDTLTAIGVVALRDGIIFAQGSVEFSGTAQTSIGETLVFTDTVGGAYTYNFDVSGTVTLTNSSVLQSGAVDFNLDTSTATSFTMSGGTVGGFSTLVLGAGQSVNGVVFSTGGTSTIPNSLVSCTFNQCGLVTVTGDLTGCTINSATGAVAVSTTNLNKVSDCTFTSDGTGYAVDLGTIAASTTMTWTSTATGYAGVDGSTGNETLLVSVDSGQTLTINDEGSGLTVHNTGLGTVNVVSGLVTLTLTGLQDLSDVVITTSDTVTPVAEVDQNVGTTYDYTYTFAASTFVDIKVIKAGYRVWVTYDYELGNTNASLPVGQVIDRAYGT